MNINFKELTFENIGSWPWAVKITSIGILCVLLIFLGYWFDNSHQLNTLASLRTQENTLFSSITTKQQQVANLKTYRQQLKQVNKIFKSLLRHLPTQSEVPGLLDDISKTGVANGLAFKLFKPLPEIQTDFYAELPIEISVVGNYHQLAQFISKVAGFDRIITLHDFTIKGETPNTAAGSESSTHKAKQQKTDNKLILNITAKTYRYTGDAESKKHEE